MCCIECRQFISFGCRAPDESCRFHVFHVPFWTLRHSALRQDSFPQCVLSEDCLRLASEVHPRAAFGPEVEPRLGRGAGPGPACGLGSPLIVLCVRRMVCALLIYATFLASVEALGDTVACRLCSVYTDHSESAPFGGPRYGVHLAVRWRSCARHVSVGKCVSRLSCAAFSIGYMKKVQQM